MNYQPTSAFSWDRVFRPSFMSRVLTFLGLRKEGIIRFLNFPSFALAIICLLFFFPLAAVVRPIWGNPGIKKLQPFFGWCWLAAFGVYRKVWYHPKVKTGEPYILMSEHFSLMDVPLYATTWLHDTRALSAKEYANIPMYGWILRSIGTFFVERRDTQKAIADLAKLKESMERDHFSVLMIPTGTRADDAQLPPFKPGVFHLAVQVKRPIVPVYLIGLEQIKVGKNFCGPGRVDVVYGEPIYPAEYPEAFADNYKLLNLVRERMLQEGRQLRAERRNLMPN
jgi:1-acyl-sn-glycerol-3-phosphate acyltransferase